MTKLEQLLAQGWAYDAKACPDSVFKAIGGIVIYARMDGDSVEFTRSNGRSYFYTPTWDMVVDIG